VRSGLGQFAACNAVGLVVCGCLPRGGCLRGLMGSRSTGGLFGVCVVYVMLVGVFGYKVVIIVGRVTVCLGGVPGPVGL
jgi:hypothetical protein